MPLKLLEDRLKQMLSRVTSTAEITSRLEVAEQTLQVNDVTRAEFDVENGTIDLVLSSTTGVGAVWRSTRAFKDRQNVLPHPLFVPVQCAAMHVKDPVWRLQSCRKPCLFSIHWCGQEVGEVGECELRN